MSLRMLSNASSSLHQLGEVQHPFLLQRIQGKEAPDLWMLLQEVPLSPAPHVRFVALSIASDVEADTYVRVTA